MFMMSVLMIPIIFRYFLWLFRTEFQNWIVIGSWAKDALKPCQFLTCLCKNNEGKNNWSFFNWFDTDPMTVNVQVCWNLVNNHVFFSISNELCKVSVKCVDSLHNIIVWLMLWSMGVTAMLQSSKCNHSQDEEYLSFGCRFHIYILLKVCLST